MKKKVVLIALAGLVFATAGCSNKAAYQNLQLNKKQECRRLPVTEYDDCMREMAQSYEEYERQRQQAIKK
jgi:PBP1b-binding outer membrane lipoprotein LpoB